jgi:hypothetical protein
MVDYNTNNSIEIFLKKIYVVWFQNIFVAKKCMSLSMKKCKYTQKMIEMIFNFSMKFVVFIKHCDSIWLE